MIKSKADLKILILAFALLGLSILSNSPFVGFVLGITWMALAEHIRIQEENSQ